MSVIFAIQFYSNRIKNNVSKNYENKKTSLT